MNRNLLQTNRNGARINFDFRLFLCPVQEITDRYGVYGAGESLDKLQVRYQEIDRIDGGILQNSSYFNRGVTEIEFDTGLQSLFV